MQIVSISGLDGSGKSTQIELLKNQLESEGRKVFYFHAVQFSIANILNGQQSTFNLPTGQAGGQRSTKSITKASWLKIQLRKVALFIDIWRFKNLTAKLEKENCDYILSDRYFYDNAINIAYLSNKDCSMFHAPYSMNIPRPDFAFYLSTDPQLIMQRDRTPEQGLEYLNKKKELLDQAAAVWNLKIINGNRPVIEINSEILATVK